MAPVQMARRWKRRAPTPDPGLDSDVGGADEDQQQLAGAVRQNTVHHANGGGAENGDDDGDGDGDDLELDLPQANPYAQQPPSANGGGTAPDEMEQDGTGANDADAAGAVRAAAGSQTPVNFRAVLTANAPATPGTPLELPGFDVPQHLRRPKIYWSAEEIQQLIHGVRKVSDRDVASEKGIIY